MGPKMSQNRSLCAGNRRNREVHKALSVLIVSAAAILAGCLSRPVLNRQFFTFATPQNTASDGSSNSQVLAIRRLSVAPPFASQSFVYRTGEFSYEQDPYAQFLVPPEDDLQEPLRGYL